jgi:hypothetical protein
MMMVTKPLPLLLISLLLTGCEEGEGLLRSLNNLLTPEDANASASDRLVPFNNAGWISRGKVDELLLGGFAVPQSTKAIHSLLGAAPLEASQDREVWAILGTTDGIMAPQLLVVLYAPSSRTNFQEWEAQSWYLTR